MEINKKQFDLTIKRHVREMDDTNALLLKANTEVTKLKL
jgi:hypothetical protein